MTSFLNSPLENSFEATLTQTLSASGSALTIYVSKTPNFTFPVGQKVRMTINPKKAFTIQEDVLVESYDNVLKTLTVSVGGRAQARYNGDTPTPLQHSVGSKIIISDPYGLWNEIQTAVNSKLDGAGGVITGPVSFSGSTTTFRIPNLTTVERDALVSPQNGMIIYNTTTGTPQIYDGGVWNNIDMGSTPVVNASTTAAGIVQIPTQVETDAGTETGSTTALLTPTPNRIAKTIQDGKWVYAADVGGTDTYAITITPAPVAYTTGQGFRFRANTVNTGAATLNVNGLGAITIKKQTNVDLSDGDIAAGQIIDVVYDGTNFQLISVTSGTPVVTTITDSFALGENVTAQDAVVMQGDGRVYQTNGGIVERSFNLIGTSQSTGVTGETKAMNMSGPSVSVPTLTATQARLWTGQTQNVNNATVPVFGVNWFAQTFTPTTGQNRVDQVDVHLTLNGTGGGGSYTLSIRATAAGLPTGPDLASVSVLTTALATGLNRFSGFNFVATPGTQYALVLRNAAATGVNNFAWGVQTTDVYATGQRCDSIDSGVSWSAVGTQDFRFIVYYNASPGTDVFLINSAGDVNHTPGTNFQRIGRAVAANKIMLLPGEPFIYATLSFGASAVTVVTTITTGFRPKAVVCNAKIGTWGSSGSWSHGQSLGDAHGHSLGQSNATVGTFGVSGIAVGFAATTLVNGTRVEVTSVGPDSLTISRLVSAGAGAAGTIHLAIFG